MKRRTFLQATAMAASWPWLIREAFGDMCLRDAGPRPGEKGPNELPAALERARRSGRSLLVLVVPRDDSQGYDRGRAFGEWLNHGAPEELAPLGRLEVVCARIADLGARQPRVDPKREPFMVLVDPQKDAPGLALGAGVLPAYEASWRQPREAKSRPDDDVFRERTELLTGLVRSALPPPSPAEVPALYAEVQRRLLRRPPPGSHWATASGCGSTVEPTPEELEAERRAAEEALERGEIRSKTVVGVGCGMGHVPPKSQRFLDFYAKTPDFTEL